VRERIEAALDRVRPLLQEDGITLDLLDVHENGASICLTGLSDQCAAAPLNFQSGLEEMLRAEIEGFGELRLIHARGSHNGEIKED
jgi:Fe-S cluster biogenesis protein NfuA